jgi:hypothetical protein
MMFDKKKCSADSSERLPTHQNHQSPIKNGGFEQVITRLSKLAPIHGSSLQRKLMSDE